MYRSLELRERLSSRACMALATIESGGEYALYAQGVDSMLAWLEQASR